MFGLNKRRLRQGLCFIAFLWMILILVSLKVKNPKQNLYRKENAEPNFNDLEEDEPQRPNNIDVNGRFKWALEDEKFTRSIFDLSLVESRLINYKEDVREACSLFLSKEELQAPVNSWEFLINHKYKLSYCSIFKAASSTWIYNFLIMADADEKRIRNSIGSPIEMAIKYYYKRPSLEELQKVLDDPHYTTFTIVREPFERLLSAYKDKIESMKQLYYAALRCKIKKHSQSEPRKSKPCNPTFSEFVSYVIDEHEQGKSPNEHWAPYLSFCSPCQANFDYILSFEMLNEDEAFLTSKIPGLSSILKAHKMHASHTDYKEITQMYYSQLSFSQLEGLFNIYGKDFDVFGYDKSNYYGYVKHDN